MYTLHFWCLGEEGGGGMEDNQGFFGFALDWSLTEDYNKDHYDSLVTEWSSKNDNGAWRERRKAFLVVVRT
jgi:hypothetical protein